MYYVSEVVTDKWEKGLDGHWNFTEKEISTFDNLHNAQQFHQELEMEENYPLTSKRWHKYIIRKRD